MSRVLTRGCKKAIIVCDFDAEGYEVVGLFWKNVGLDNDVGFININHTRHSC